MTTDAIPRTLLVFVLALTVIAVSMVSASFADPPLIGEPFAISAASSREVRPKVAHNPSRQRFLVVWAEQATQDAVTAGGAPDGAIRALAVSELGEPIGQAFFLGDGRTPDVAYNAAADLFLVVWSAASGMEIQARRVSGDGTVADPTFPVSLGRPDGEIRPAVAFNEHPQFLDFLVVWEDGAGDFPGGTTRRGIWGQRVTGTEADPQLTGDAVQIADAGSGGPWHEAPDVTYNLGRNEYLVVYSRTPSAPAMATPDIVGRRVTGAGTLLPEEIIDDSIDGQGLPVVASFHPNETTPYLVAYLDFSTSAQGDIRGRLLNADGQPAEALDIATRSDRVEEEPAIAGGEALGGYQILWSEGVEDEIVIGRRVSDTGLMSPPFPVSRSEAADASLSGEGGMVRQRSPAVAAESPLGLAVWQDSGIYTNTEDIAGRLLGFAFTGRVRAGAVGEEGEPLADVMVALFCSEGGGLGVLVAETATDAEGAYLLVAPANCPVYNIVESDPPGRSSEGATSLGGSVIEPNWIQYVAPLDEKELFENNFWDEASATPTQSPTVSSIPTASTVPTATATLVVTTTPSVAPSPTATGSVYLTVNTTDDSFDGLCDSSHCSLREAITAADLRSGPDEIRFAIPGSDGGCNGSGVCRIRPQTAALPELAGGNTTIDGFTQGGANPNTSSLGEAINAIPKIVIDGSLLASCCPVGIEMRSSGNTVRGLVIQNFYSGVQILSGSDNTVAGNFIGTNATGASGAGNGCSGIVLSSLGGGPGSSNNTLGGSSPADRNLISDNACGGIEIGPGQSNLIQGNYIGTDATGTAPLPNDGDGVRVFNASQQHRIGGIGAGEQNVIAFNRKNGVAIDAGAGAAARNTIQRNRIFSNDLDGIGLIAGGNGGIAAPVITSAARTRVSGTACASCTVEVFSDSDAQGAVYEGTVLADAAGNWAFDQAAGLAGPNVTATATDGLGNTSEFSGAAAIGASTPTATTTYPTSTATVASPTSTATAPTAGPTNTAGATRTATTSVATPTAPSPTPAGCSGDCDGDGKVSIAELIRGVNIALGRTDISVCPSFDQDGDGSVRINELIAAVNHALSGCTSS